MNSLFTFKSIVILALIGLIFLIIACATNTHQKETNSFKCNLEYAIVDIIDSTNNITPYGDELFDDIYNRSVKDKKGVHFIFKIKDTNGYYSSRVIANEIIKKHNDLANNLYVTFINNKENALCIVYVKSS